jgi:hypothetical protein
MEAQLEANRIAMLKLQEDNARLTNELEASKAAYKRDVALLEEITRQKRKLEKELEMLEDRLAEEKDDSSKLKDEVTKLHRELECKLT